MENAAASFAVGHLEQPALLSAAVARIRPTLVVFYLDGDRPRMLETYRRFRSQPDSGMAAFLFAADAPVNTETTLEEGADGMLAACWSQDELVVRVVSLLRAACVNRENRRRSQALAQASAEAADIILQLEEASRKIQEQNQCISAQQKEIAENLAKVEHELRIASILQISLLPSPREYSADFGIVIQDRYIPATDLGGDYFDYVKCPDGRLFICVADVTGHGVAPAMVSVQLRALARSHLLAGQGLGAVFSDLNTFMYETFHQEYLMTMAGVLYAPDTGVITFTGAGHCPLIHYLAAEGKCVERFSRGLPLGVMEDGVFTEEEFQLAPGDALLLYSDGITETDNDAEGEFGAERLVVSFQDSIRSGAVDVPDALLAAVQAFTGKKSFADDVSLVALRRPGGE